MAATYLGIYESKTVEFPERDVDFWQKMFGKDPCATYGLGQCQQAGIACMGCNRYQAVAKQKLTPVWDGEDLRPKKPEPSPVYDG